MKWKKIYALLMAALLLAAACFRTCAAEAFTLPDEPGAFALQPEKEGENGVNLGLPCAAALLMSSDTGEVLYEYNADTELAMASITKVMTLLLTFEALDEGRVRLEDRVPVSEHAFSMGGSQIWLEPGEQFTLDEMIKAICVSSANDAAVAVAEFVGGSEPAFVERMNRRAKELGMAHTCFKNACGLDEEGHYSTARDVAVMSYALMRHPKVFEYTGIWTDTLRGGATLLTNTNKLLRSYQGITGLKTGTTGKAGVCISATAARDGTGLIAVILGAPSSRDRFDAARTLLDYGFAHYVRADLPAAEGLPAVLKVHRGSAPEVRIGCTMPGSIVLKKETKGSLSCRVEVEQSLEAPVTAGQKVGEVALYSGGQKCAAYPVTASDSVEKMSFSLGMNLLLENLFAQ